MDCGFSDFWLCPHCSLPRQKIADRSSVSEEPETGGAKLVVRVTSKIVAALSLATFGTYIGPRPGRPRDQTPRPRTVDDSNRRWPGQIVVGVWSRTYPQPRDLDQIVHPGLAGGYRRVATRISRGQRGSWDQGHGVGPGPAGRPTSWTGIAYRPVVQCWRPGAGPWPRRGAGATRCLPGPWEAWMG